MASVKRTPSGSGFKPKPLAKCGTGVDGLDDVLEGGYPMGRTTMVTGGPGAGKTLFALQFLVRSALKGTPGLLVTFEESPEAIRTNAATLGWDLPKLEKKGLISIITARLDFDALNVGLYSLAGLMAVIEGKSKSMGSRLLIIDAIDILMRRFEDPSRARDQINGLHEWLDQHQITAFLSVKSSDDPELLTRFSFLDYISDCVIRLDHRVSEQISTRRLRVLKYRGSSFRSNEYPYIIGAGGISLIPIASAQLVHMPMGAFQSSGNRELDLALNGGYRHNACVLIAGSSGTGKTTLVCTFVHAACARGEKSLYISFEESPQALIYAVLSAGIDLAPHVRAGRLEILASLPESKGADEHLHQHLQLIESLHPDHVVVDAISACHRMGSGKAAFDYCMRLVNTCKEKGITCLLTNQMKKTPIGDDVSGLGFASLVDTVIQLQYVIKNKGLCRRLVILKARGSKHSPRFHDFRITDNGIELASSGSTVVGRSRGEADPVPPATGGGR